MNIRKITKSASVQTSLGEFEASKIKVSIYCSSRDVYMDALPANVRFSVMIDVNQHGVVGYSIRPLQIAPIHIEVMHVGEDGPATGGGIREFDAAIDANSLAVEVERGSGGVSPQEISMFVDPVTGSVDHGKSKITFWGF